MRGMQERVAGWGSPAPLMLYNTIQLNSMSFFWLSTENMAVGGSHFT